MITNHLYVKSDSSHTLHFRPMFFCLKKKTRQQTFVVQDCVTRKMSHHRSKQFQIQLIFRPSKNKEKERNESVEAILSDYIYILLLHSKGVFSGLEDRNSNDWRGENNNKLTRVLCNQNNHSQSSKIYTADGKEKRQIVIKIIHCLQRGRSMVRTGHLRWIDLLTITNFEDEMKNIRHFSFANEFKYQSRVTIAHEERVEFV